MHDAKEIATLRCLVLMWVRVDSGSSQFPPVTLHTCPTLLPTQSCTWPLITYLPNTVANNRGATALGKTCSYSYLLQPVIQIILAQHCWEHIYRAALGPSKGRNEDLSTLNFFFNIAISCCPYSVSCIEFDVTININTSWTMCVLRNTKP